jgi:hypothetical protein
VDQFRERQDGDIPSRLVTAGLDLAHDGHAGSLAARIEFKANRLQDAVRLPPIHQADGEGHHAVHARAAARQQ